MMKQNLNMMFFVIYLHMKFLNQNFNLLDFETKRSQYLENKDEYFFDYINSENLINYYFNNNLFADYNKTRFFDSDYEYDKPSDPFDYLFFLFVDRGLLMLLYLFFFYYCYYLIFFFFFFFFFLFNHIYFFHVQNIKINLERQCTRDRTKIFFL